MKISKRSAILPILILHILLAGCTERTLRVQQIQRPGNPGSTALKGPEADPRARKAGEQTCSADLPLRCDVQTVGDQYLFSLSFPAHFNSKL